MSNTSFPYPLNLDNKLFWAQCVSEQPLMLIKIRAFATVTIKILTSKIFFQNTNYLDQFPARLPQTEHTEGQVYAFNSIQ